MNKNNAISLAVTSIIRDGLSDITTEKLEIELISKYRIDFEAEIKEKLNKVNIDEMEFKPIQHLLTPKNRYIFDYRKAAIISPSCLAKYLAIVFQYAEIVEKARIPTSENIVFSYRFSPSDNSIFSKDIGYSQWREETKKRAEGDDCEFIVSCDIAAFYDRVNLHRIQSTLTSIGVEEKLVKLTNDLLSFWSKKDSYGIPVGNVASRILAETVLIDIDKYLLSRKIQFTRYVDDYRFFAPDLITAQNWMNKLTTRLFRDGLMLNTGKTQIRKSRKIKNESDMFKEEQTSEVVLKTITILTGGYNKISRKFTMPADDKHEVFKQINIDSELKLLQEEDIVEFQGVQKIVIAALIQQKFELLLKIAAACFQYLYTLDYFIDMLLKNAAFIPTEIKRSIANVYIEQIDNLYIFEWHSASVARLLSHESYFDKEALLKIVNSPAKDISTYASMIALDGLQNKLSRSEFITIRNYFERCDDWERRRLLNLSEALPIEERKAWGRAMMLTVANDFLNKKLCKELARG